MFEGLPGVFNDSLPDGWGRLLIDRKLRAIGIDPGELTPLDRLAMVGSRGMGALTYEPDHSEGSDLAEAVNLDELAKDAEKIMAGKASEVLDELIALNGSSAGARPKAMIAVNPDFSQVIHGVETPPAGFSSWLVKFPSSQDQGNAGPLEYAYAQAAQAAGLEITPTHLFPAKTGGGYFATQRFDRVGYERVHVHSVCGLVHSNFRLPSLDYDDLLTLTMALTKDHREVEKAFQLAVFNVLSHNQDDHSKNISFIMSRDEEWKLSPAYDLTYSTGLGGEQSTTVLGKGKKITEADFLKLAENHKIKPAKAEMVLEQVRDAVKKHLVQKGLVSAV